MYCHIFVLITVFHRRYIGTFHEIICFCLQYLIDLLLCLLTEGSVSTIGVCGVEARMESHIERCCGLGTLWAANGVRCTKFTGPVSGVPQMEQGICLEAFAICCDQVYREKGCEKGKEDARAGSACMREEKPKKHSSEQQRDCCKGCKLGKSYKLKKP